MGNDSMLAPIVRTIIGKSLRRNCHHSLSAIMLFALNGRSEACLTHTFSFGVQSCTRAFGLTANLSRRIRRPRTHGAMTMTSPLTTKLRGLGTSQKFMTRTYQRQHQADGQQFTIIPSWLIWLRRSDISTLHTVASDPQACAALAFRIGWRRGRS